MRTIEDDALLLPPEKRELLAARLLASLEPEPEIEKQWLAQAVRRAAEIDQGMVKLIPAEEVMRQALALCR